MEVVSALASSLQIVGQCGQVTMTIIKWVESVRTVDERIDAFVYEVNTLRTTYETLSQSLKDPSMLEAARITNRDVGGHLWTEMSRTLRDCERTMVKITNVLRRIQGSSNPLRRVIKQLRESLSTGELVRLREQVVMFNSSLQLPMQMITLTLQLRQAQMTTAHQLQLNDQIASLRSDIQRIEVISKGLVTTRRQVSVGESTIIGDSTDDGTWFTNMESYVGTAKKFLDNASVAASTLSAPSTNRHSDDGPPALDIRRGSAFVPLTHQKLKSISMYVDDLPARPGLDTPLASDAQSTTEASHDAPEDSDEDDDTDLQLLEALLSNGRSEQDKGDFATAEDNYREALSLSQSHSFESRIACSTADITLLLCECIVKQEKYDEAVTLLLPLANQLSLKKSAVQPGATSLASDTRRLADKGQALSASHLLGEVYLKKADYIHAETHAVQAFKGRKKLLGDNHPRTIESVSLVIDMYKAKGQSARAEAHRIFLKPAKPVQELRTMPLGPPLSLTPSPPAPQTAAMPIESPTRPRRPTFNFSSPFKRLERFETQPASMPMRRNGNLSGNGSHFLGLDEPTYLSTSPHETSSLHIGSDIQPVDRQARQNSSNSNGSYANAQGWMTVSDGAEPPTALHQKTGSSLSKVPTLYAAMSRSDMEQKFTEIADLCKAGKTSKAVDKGVAFLQRYDPDSIIFVHRAAELKENIKKSKTKGLAGTGYGFAPLHFFCSLKFEPLLEIDVLLKLEADVDAVAYKAGYGSNKTNPFTPLFLAAERGHHNIVRMLLERGATGRPEAVKSGFRFTSDRDTYHPLLQACSRGHVRAVEELLEHGITLSEESFPKSWYGNSLLHQACFRCDLALVEYLMNFARRKGKLNDSWYSFVGRPGQQDVFGVTPIMYAIDMRDTNDQKLRTHKLRTRVYCLKLLLEWGNELQLEETDNGEVFVDHPQGGSPGRLAADLQIEDKKGNTVYWYADESRGGDAELRAFLDEQSRRSRLIDI